MEFKDSPMAQFQDSPTESLMSIPGENFASLFAVTTPSATSTMNPMEMMTPQSCSEDQTSSFTHIKEEDDASSTPSPSPTPEKKTAKKRKSWGQVLPEPKTSLPPRKRAKTDDEKEQRRVERVLRNRRAAQSSRERKRQEVEALEKRNQELEAAYKKLQEDHANLKMQFQQAHSSGLVTHSSPLESFRENPSLSQGLFNPQATHTGVDELVSSNTTVDPTTLSPQLLPVAESFEETLDEEPSKEAKLEQTESTSPDLTQRPAAMLSDLQCHMSAEMPKSFLLSQTSMALTSAWLLQLQMTLHSALAALMFFHRPLTQIAVSLKAGISLHPTPQLLATIIWLVTLPRSVSTTTLTSVSSSTTTQMPSRQNLWQRATSPLRPVATSPRRTNLRFKSLRKILSSSPILARPLADATLVALRLVTEGCDNQVEVLRRGTDGSRGQDDELTQYLTNMALPSRELLMTLLWAIRLEERRIQHETGEVLEVETRSQLHTHQPTVKTVLPVLSEEEFDWADAREGLLRSEDLS
ncbi:transcriptional activator hac1 [Fusarium avenaceum]|nr:transcriptional activator hac1 [Fusarium avenaceum]